MSKASKIMKTMLAGENAPVKAVRTTQFIQQDDGSTIRRVLDADGRVLSESTLTQQQCLSLNTRASLGLSQQGFAELLGISTRTLHDWEQGRREPSGAAKTLLKIAAQYPEVVQNVMQQHVTS
ncbi:helix-turn-helix domain-containing protein [Desulfovibrio sp. OttesenSCG-928-M16]|nr:helix-turn-helix domain-containing protein [Desulfovibrio sp. OttesenSCG-928-M16]